MFDCPEDFSQEQLRKIKSIIQIDDFRKINTIVNICDLNQNEEDIIKNIKDYIWTYLANNNSSDFSLSVNNFISFVENYQKKSNPQFTLPSQDGKVCNLKNDLLVISNGYHIHKDFRYLKFCNANGLYMKNSYLGSNHKVYLSKKSMQSKTLGVSREIVKEVDYNSLVAESFFRYFLQPVASYYLLQEDSQPFNLLFTPSFLKDNQELIHLSDFDVEEDNNYFDTHSNRLKILKDNLQVRYGNKMDEKEFQKMIEKIQLQYCIQTFLKLLIGPMDINFGNTAIILTHENGSFVPSIDIAPAYDLDISFNIATELVENNMLDQVKDIDGNPSTIMSLVKEFKDISGFKDFLTNFVKIITNYDVSEKILDNVYQRTNLDFFKEKKETYVSFLNKRFIEALMAYRNVFLKEEVNETTLGR